MFVCLALPLRTLQENIRSAFVLGVKKAHYFVPALLIGWGLIGVSAYLVSLATEGAFSLLVLCVALFFFVMTLVQMGFVALVHEVAGQNS